ncbi:MAG: hypothetical protein HC794_10675 [Nitrospiraceae bacterium]|nr:hypothetical protein [Nitrospiraceae bacterium]
MTTQGLFINQNGQDFLLTTEFHHEMKTHRLIVLQRVKGEWQQLTGIQENACRESLIAAFVDFFVDICRVLNSTNSEFVAPRAPISRRARAQGSSQPNLRSVL